MKPFLWDTSPFASSYNYNIGQLEKIPIYNVARLSNAINNQKICYDGDDTVYITEGIISASPGTQRISYKFTLSTRTYSTWTFAPFLTNYCGADMIYCNGAVYTFGGYSGSGGSSTYSGNVFKYTVATNTWTNLGSRTVAGFNIALCKNGTDIYWWGGASSGTYGSATVGKLNTLNDTFSSLTSTPNLPFAGWLNVPYSALAHNGKNLYACFANIPGSPVQIGLYRLDGTIWTLVNFYSYANSYYAGSPIAKGDDIFFVGGINPSNTAIVSSGKVLRTASNILSAWGTNISGTVSIFGSNCCFEDKSGYLWCFFSYDTSLAAPQRINLRIPVTYGIPDARPVYQLREDAKTFSDAPNFITSSGFNFGSPITPTIVNPETTITFKDMLTTNKVALMIDK